jgi:hypothetical protein
VLRASVFKFFASELIFSGTEGAGSRFHVLHFHTHCRRYRGRRVSFSCFALSNPFSCFAFHDPFRAEPRASSPIFMFRASRHVFGGTESDGSHFHVLCSRTHFRLYRGHWVPFSWFALPSSFSTVPSASDHALMFCAPELVFGYTEGVGSSFHILRSRTHFRRYRGRRVLFSCFGLLNPFRAESRVEPRTHFRRYQGRRVPISCFSLPDSFSTVPRASVPVLMFCTFELVFDDTEALAPVLMFCASGLIFGCIEGVGSSLHVLRSRTSFRRDRRHQVPFSCFALPSSFSAVPRSSGTVYMFCVPELVFVCNGGFGSRFHD